MNEPGDREGAMVRAVVALACESWRVMSTLDRLGANLDANQQRRLASRLAFHRRNVDAALADVGLRLVDVTGADFSPQLPATAVNADSFGPDDRLVVEQVIEPTVVGPAGVVRLGTVTLRRTGE